MLALTLLTLDKPLLTEHVKSVYAALIFAFIETLSQLLHSRAHYAYAHPPRYPNLTQTKLSCEFVCLLRSSFLSWLILVILAARSWDFYVAFSRHRLPSGVIWCWFAELVFTLRAAQTKWSWKSATDSGQLAAQASCPLARLDMQTTLSFITNFDIDAGKASKGESRKPKTENRKPKTKTKSVARFVSIINDKFGKIRINMRGKLNWILRRGL